MSSQSELIKKLLEQPVWSTQERKLLLNFIEHSDDADFKEIMEDSFLKDLKAGTSIDPVISEKLLNSIHKRIGFKQKQKKVKWVRMWVLRASAACLVGFLILNFFLRIKDDTKPSTAQIPVIDKKYKNDIQPGTNKALLTLADGSTISLEDAKNEWITQQGDTRVKNQDGTLDYNASGERAGKAVYNTVSTPRGGQYRIVLPDGSRVWLNAASSLKFPIAFAGEERKVEITGEAYFEVAENKAKPFIVSVNGAEIRVLGTHFDVMAYGDESILETTLLEGSIEFVKDDHTAALRPGQQVRMSREGQLKVADNIDLTKVVAWKNGLFDFEDTDFKTIARQLSRWYDVEIVYNREINDLFYAEIPRDTKLSVVLKALELTGKVHFEIEGSKIIVLP